MSRHRTPYTPAEDAAILAAPRAGVAALAERLGRTRGAITSRRYELRRTGVAYSKISLAQLAPRSHRPPPPGPNFARPAFFESENLHKIALARR